MPKEKSDETTVVDTGDTTVAITKPASTEKIDDSGEDVHEALAEFQGRFEALENRISEIVAGNETWRTTTQTSLMQEIADLKAELLQLQSAVPDQAKALREELTQLSQQISQKVSAPQIPGDATTITTVEAVVIPDKQAGTSAENAPAPGADADARPVPVKSKKKVHYL